LPCRNCTHFFRMIATTFISLSWAWTTEQAPGTCSSLELQDTPPFDWGGKRFFLRNGTARHDTLLLDGNGFYKGQFLESNSCVFPAWPFIHSFT
jgi:hypothetical protein